jgi:hypothetical protein
MAIQTQSPHHSQHQHNQLSKAQTSPAAFDFPTNLHHHNGQQHSARHAKKLHS